ncbi:MAG: PQQ-binding-like beta-propeller repeat protein [Candidatus Dormibacteria bacterium]
MRRFRLLPASAALAVAGLSMIPLAARAGVYGCSLPTVNDRCESWATVYDDPAITQGSDQLEPRVAVSHDGSRVFVAAIDEALNSSDPYNSPASWVVLAYDGHSGAQLWSSTYQSTGHYDRPNAITVSADGAAVYVTGGSYDAPLLESHDRDLVTIAYDATTGAQRWRTRNVDANVHDVGTDIVSSPDGSQVYVTVNIEKGGGEIDWAGEAYDATTGAVLWRTEYDGITTGVVNSPAGMAISHDGRFVYITGQSGGTTQFDLDYATVAYATGGVQPGSVAWSSRYDGVGHQYPDRPAGITVDADGRVVVTGDSISNFSTSVADDFATVAYDGTTGAQLWASRYSGPAGGVNFGMAVASSPSSALAVVTGQIEPSGKSGDTAWATLAYDTSTGAQLWEQTLNTPEYSTQFPVAVAVTRDGNDAVVTGYSGARAPTPLTPPVAGGDAVTVTYALSGGAQQWIARYSANLTDGNTPRALALSDEGDVFTTVQVAHDTQTDTSGSGNHYDIATMAYLAAPASDVPEGAPWWFATIALCIAGAALFRVRR